MLDRGRRRWQYYHTVWLLLFMAWMFSYVDRTLTGPVVIWMIDHDVSFLANAPMPHALGGIIGSMFFAGYMLTQYPAGYLGDRYGRKVMVVISTVWAGIATFFSGVARTLETFVAARVSTGLGEGAYYSNDRAIITESTPFEKKALGMGVVFVGLATGLTIGLVVTYDILDWAAGLWGPEVAWSVPFLLFAGPTILVGVAVSRLIRDRGAQSGGAQDYRGASSRLVAYAVVFLGVIMGTFLLTLYLGWTPLIQALVIALVALALVAAIYVRLGRESAPVLKERNLLLMYVSAIPILYTLWFFGFWVALVVAEGAEMDVPAAVIYAGFFGIANAIGYPLGGVVSDRLLQRGWPRRRIYIILCGAVVTLVVAMGAYTEAGGRNIVVLGGILFALGVPFAAMQTVHMALTSDLAPPEMMAQAFGMWNLVAEFGALFSPVVAGTLRDLTGSWTWAIGTDALLLVASLILVAFVRERSIG